MSTKDRKSTDVDPPAHTETPPKKRAKASPATDRERDVGHALRSIYQRTVDESVPQEMLDLLGKLG